MKLFKIFQNRSTTQNFNRNYKVEKQKESNILANQMAFHSSEFQKLYSKKKFSRSLKTANLLFRLASNFEVGCGIGIELRKDSCYKMFSFL